MILSASTQTLLGWHFFALPKCPISLPFPPLPPSLSKVTVRPQRPLLCGGAPLPPGRWSRTGLPFSQGHFLTALCSTNASDIPVFNPPHCGWQWQSLVPLVPPPRCEVLRGHHAAPMYTFQPAAVAPQWLNNLNSDPCPPLKSRRCVC